MGVAVACRTSLWRGIAFILLFNGLLAAWLLLKPAPHATVVVVDNIARFLGPLLLVPLCVGRVSVRTSRRSRQYAPAIIGAGVLVHSLGRILYTYDEQIRHGATAPFPSWADAAFLAYYPIMLIGLLLLPARPLSLAARLRVVLDGLTIMTAVATFSWFFVLGPTVLQGGALPARIVGVAYPCGDLVLVCCLLLLWTRANDARMRSIARLFAAGLIINVVTDSVYDIQQLTAVYHVGGLLDVGWPLAYMLIALATYGTRRSLVSMDVPIGAKPAREEQEQALEAPRLWRVLLPYLLVPPVGALAGYTWLNWGPDDGDKLEPGVFAGAAILVGLILSRQVLDLLENRRLHRVLRAREERFRALSEHASDLVTIFSADGAIHYASPSHQTILGYAPEQLLGTQLFAFMHPGDLARVRERFALRVQEGGQGKGVELRMRHADGTWRTIEAAANNRLNDPAVGGVIVTSRDVTERKRAEDALRASKENLELLAAAINNITTGVLITDPHQADSPIVFTNPAFSAMTGYAVDDIIGRNCRFLQGPDTDPVMVRKMRTALDARRPFRGVVLNYRKDGAPFWNELTVNPVFGDDGQVMHFVGLLSDVSERMRMEEQLQRQASHDALTALPNRLLLHDRMAQALAAAERGQHPLALLLLDLDRFKEVNDTFGHHYGDLLLQHAGARLRATLRQSDTVARLGGDEFAVLMLDGDRDGALRLAATIHDALDAPFVVDGQSLQVGASLGIALYPEHGGDAQALLRRADVAMYVAKREHRGYALYEEAQDEHNASRLALAGALRHAIEHDALLLHYQPKVELGSGRVSGVEALVRWQHPERGLIPPDVFVPLAEQTGLIAPLTLWVLDAALRQCRAWRSRGVTIEVSVNLSMWDLRDASLVDAVSGMLAAYGVAPPLLCLELTESSIMADAERALDVLTRLSALGARISIDDFGTGYSSLAYLKRLPVDELKIDRSFVQHLATDENDTAIVCSTIGLGHSLGLRVVAEGVEDERAWNLLAGMGCDVAQGYYLSRPLPASELDAWLSASLWSVA